MSTYLHSQNTKSTKSNMKLLELLLFLFFFKLTLGALPKFSWDTLPVFFHSANQSGPYSDEALKVIAKYPMVTIEKFMGYDDNSMDDEDFMVQAMKAVKKINPNVATYFYMASFANLPEMSRMAREFKEHPDYALRAENGQLVTAHGYNVFDLSNPKVRQWWLNICLNATKFANGDGCFCDGSQRVQGLDFKPSISKEKLKAWGDGLLTLTRDVQNALGSDKLLIGKVPNQPYVKAVQIEFFRARNDSINNLTLGIRNGQVVQVHVPLWEIDCKGDLTDYIAAFLIGAGEQSYFGCGNWTAEGNDSTPFMWRPEYDKPLGRPTAPATYHQDSGIWKREFESGTKVTFDTNSKKGTIQWGTIPKQHQT